MHRHGSFPTPVPPARVGSRLQPTLAAASTGQLHRRVPSRLVCHPGSSSVRAGPPPGRPNCGVGSALKLVKNGARGAATRCALDFEGGLREEVPAREAWLECSTRHSSSRKRSSARRCLPAKARAEPPDKASARTWQSGSRPSHSTPNSRLSQINHLFTFWFWMTWKMKRSWTADALCRLDSDCAPVGDSGQENEPPWALIAH